MSSIFKGASITMIHVICDNHCRKFTATDKSNTTLSRVLLLYGLGNRYYAIAKPVDITITLRLKSKRAAVLKYHFDTGFKTNFRSGGVCVDCFVDQLGTELEQIDWLTHDANYTPCARVTSMNNVVMTKHPLSKNDADELLYIMLVFAGLSTWKAKVVWTSVHLFGKSAYNDDDNLTETNKKLFTFTAGGIL